MAIPKSNTEYTSPGDAMETNDAYILGSDEDLNGKNVSEYNYIKVSDIMKDFENQEEDTEESNE